MACKVSIAIIVVIAHLYSAPSRATRQGRSRPNMVKLYIDRTEIVFKRLRKRGRCQEVHVAGCYATYSSKTAGPWKSGPHFSNSYTGETHICGAIVLITTSYLLVRACGSVQSVYESAWRV